MTDVCPECGAYNRVGDNHGDTCTNYGYNLEYGGFGRRNRNVTHHVFVPYCEDSGSTRGRRR